MNDLDGMVREWDGTAVVHGYDPPTGARIFVAMHDTRLGSPVGGTRMKRYPAPEEALRDAMRLAEGMTYKWASIDMAFGGGKAVIDVPSTPRGEEREAFFHRYGRLLETLRGSFRTGVDLGTDPADMDVLAEATDHVLGRRSGAEGGTVDPGPYTALGVFESIRASLAHRFGDPAPADRRVLVQGLGDVGRPLVELLHEAGAELLLCDLDAGRARAAADEVGGRVVAAAELYGTRCDVFAPCAVGGILEEETIPRLACEIVAGSANNQLDTPADADRLHERGILWAPDYVANSGGALAFGLLHGGTRDPDALRERVRGIGDSMRAILEEAASADESPLHAARRVAEVRLRAAGHG